VCDVCVLCICVLHTRMIGCARDVYECLCACVMNMCIHGLTSVLISLPRTRSLSFPTSLFLLAHLRALLLSPNLFIFLSLYLPPSLSCFLLPFQLPSRALSFTQTFPPTSLFLSLAGSTILEMNSSVTHMYESWYHKCISHGTRLTLSHTFAFIARFALQSNSHTHPISKWYHKCFVKNMHEQVMFHRDYRVMTQTDP